MSTHRLHHPDLASDLAPELARTFLSPSRIAQYGEDDGIRRTAPAPFVPYRGSRPWEEQHPARPLVWALVWIVVPTFWAGTIYWLTQAVY